jgi:DNA polymerase-3 subunit delta
LPIKFAQLDASLEAGLKPVYLVAGAEPLLVQEAREKIVAAARTHGFEERELMQAERGFEWDSELGAASAPSLFATRKVLDLRLPSGRPGREGARALTEWAESPDDDTLLILSFGQWDAASRKSRWAQSLDRAGVVVEIWPLKPAEMPGWISQRLKSAGLAADRAAVSLLAALVEGNLLAAQQEIDKLVMAGHSGALTADDIESAVANSSRFDAFRLAECALNGDAVECLRVSSGLLRNHVHIQPVAAALYNELALTDGLKAAVVAGENERS